MEKEPITSQGLEKIKKELEELKKIKRPKIVEAIAEARAHGDLKENAEYHAAKEQQSHNEGRIQEIEDIIARANVIDVSRINNDVAIMQSTVTRLLKEFLQNSVTLMGLLLWVFYLKWDWALMALIVFPVMVFPVSNIGRKQSTKFVIPSNANESQSYPEKK